MKPSVEMTVSSPPGMNVLPGSDAITRFLNEGLAGPIVTGIREAATNLFDTLGGQLGRSGTSQQKRHKFEQCCDPAPTRCECQCCIVDADVVVYARLGETLWQVAE